MTSDITATLKSLAQDETIQRMLVQHLFKDVLTDELRRRKLPEQLLTMQELADILDIDLQTLYKKFQRKEVAIKHVCIGRGGAKRFEPADVRQWLKDNKITPVRRPESLKRRSACQ